ncbi:MAG: Rieske 2Fe-2S domain-containing protein [Candidatus Binatia bacterium]
MDNTLVNQLKEYWYVAAESTELRSRPLARTILGERLVLFRQADGTPATLIDRCAHRNMVLSRGRLQNGSLECPYHGWRYRGDGQCIHIPSLPEGAISPGGIAIRSYPTAQNDGYVWVYMGSMKPAGPPPLFPHYGERGWTTFKMKTRFQAGAFACLENFLDCPHTVYVHRGWFRSREAKEVRAQVMRNGESVEVRFFDERDAKSVVSNLLFPRAHTMSHTDRFFMPATSRVDYSFGPNRHFIITSQCTPISDYETEVYTVITFRFGKIAPLVRLLFEPLARRIIRQDVRILEAQTEQLRRFGGAQFTFVETDLIGPHILKLWQNSVDSNSNGDSSSMTDHPAMARQEVVLRF